jgi:hypothetical protein
VDLLILDVTGRRTADQVLLGGNQAHGSIGCGFFCSLMMYLHADVGFFDEWHEIDAHCIGPVYFHAQRKTSEWFLGFS